MALPAASFTSPLASLSSPTNGLKPPMILVRTASAFCCTSIGTFSPHLSRSMPPPMGSSVPLPFQVPARRLLDVICLPVEHDRADIGIGAVAANIGVPHRRGNAAALGDLQIGRLVHDAEQKIAAVVEERGAGLGGT